MGFDLLMSSVIMVPQLVRSLDSLFITAVSAGDHHSLFLSDQGRVYSCGWSRSSAPSPRVPFSSALPFVCLTATAARARARTDMESWGTS
jgi:alpha-tubulin suppressor-like RCC1 family protein